MERILFLLLCPISCWANDLFPDEKVLQFIIIENNTEKCFQPELWNAKDDIEYNKILSHRSEMDIILDLQYEISLMSELFGNDATTKIFENKEIQEQFNKKLEKLSTKETTVNSQQECEEVSKYRLYLKKKHIY